MQPLVLPPRREFLVDQVAALLRQEIAAGRWPGWLPGERSLIKIVNVSRPTLRGALQQLVAGRELILRPRQGYQVGRLRPTASQAKLVNSTKVGVICPERLFSMPAALIQIVDLLRTMCAESDLHLELFEGPRFARTDPGRFMPQMVRSHPKACWIPIMADRRMQAWFASSRTPAVIYGNVYPDLRLPSAGVDYRACINHATSLLLAKGHRRIALVTYDPKRAGEQESLAGFRAAFREPARDGAIAFEISRPNNDVAALCRQVDRLLKLPRPPTAFIVCRTQHYATVATRLLESGRRIPFDISLICRGEDTFLNHFSPAPAYYHVNLELLARTLFRAVLRVAGGATRPNEHHRVVPQFIAGASVGPAPVATR